MTGWWPRLVIVVLVLVAAAYVALRAVFPAYGHRYRLTVAIDDGGVPRTGSSVIDVTWRKQPYLPDAPPFVATIRGHAPVVDLGPRGIVIATLDPYGDPTDRRSVGVQYLALRGLGPFGDRPRSFPPTVEGLRALERHTGRAELTPDNMPQFVWIPDVGDVGTARRVEPEAFPTVIGPEVRLRSVTIETTGDPVERMIPGDAPWLRQLRHLAAQRQFGHSDRLTLFLNNVQR